MMEGEVKMSENELKSCPFCGGKAETFYWQGYINDECHSNLTCTTCGAGFHDILSEENTFKMWNKRIVKHGEWTTIDDISRCSERGYIPPYDNAIDDIFYSNYCPNCGAKMNEDD